MIKPKKGKRLSPDKLQNLEYNNTIERDNSLPKDKTKFLDALSGVNPTYSGEFSPSPITNTAGAARRVDFGEEGFNERLGSGMTSETNPNDIYYSNQGGLETLGKFVGHSASGAVTKAIGGIASLGSLLGEGGLSAVDSLLGGSLEKLGYDGEFNWDDATENPLVKGITDAEKWMNEKLFKVYQPTNWNDKNFFEQVIDGAWWGNEGADGVAFALSNFIPAAILGKAGIGARAMMGLADLGEMNAATRFLTAGRAGLLRAENILEGADRAVSTAFMTASESIFEAKDTGETITNQYLQRYNQARGTNIETIEELSQIDPVSAEDLKAKKGDAMKHTFFANMAALSASNWIEAGLLSKFMGKGTRGVVASEIDAGEKFLDPIARVQRKGLDKFFNNTRVGYTAKTIGQQMVTEGLYEENIQHAIQNVAQNLSLNGKIDNMKFIEDIGKEFFTNMGDKEAWKSIGAGMVIGGMFGGVGATGIPGISKGAFREKEEAITKGVSKLNEVSNNLRAVGQIYNEDGSFNKDKLENYVANLAQAKNIQAIHDHYKSKGENELAEIVKNEHIANYVKGFMEVGLKDDLLLKVKDLQKISTEDLTKWGFDPIDYDFSETDGVLDSKAKNQQRFRELENKVTDYANQYDYLSKTIPSNERARQGEALSWYARYQHLDNLEKKLNKNATSLSVNIESGSEGLVTTINKLAKEYSNKLAELPNQEKFSLPKRIAQTRKELLLLEKEIISLKEQNKQQLEELGINVSPNVEIIQAEESPKSKELETINRTLTQVRNAKQDAKDNYDGLVDEQGGSMFYASLLGKVEELGKEEENWTQSDSYNEGDYITIDNGEQIKSGFISTNDRGELTFGNEIFDDNFISNNNIEKLNESQINELKNQEVEKFRKEQLESKITNVQSQIDILSGKINKGNDFILEQIISKEDIILNAEKGEIRISQRELAKQLKQIEKTILDAENRLNLLEETREEASNKLSELKYLYDNPETIDDVNNAIAFTENEIIDTEAEIAKVQPLLERAKSLYYSMLNLWKSLFPSKEYKSLEDRALEIESAIENGADPASFENEGLDIANKLSEYTEYKQDLQLTRAEMKSLERDLDELNIVRNLLYGDLENLNNKLAEYELQLNKFNYTKTLKPEQGQKESSTNPVSKSKLSEKNPFNSPKQRDVSNALWATVGSHFKEDSLTTDESQLRWFKFTESYNPLRKEYRLRTVSINDEIYGLGKEKDIYKNDSKQYQNENHYKVLVVDNEGNPITRNGDLVFTSLAEPKESFNNYTNIKKLSSEVISKMNDDYKSFLNKAKLEPQYLDITGRSNGIARKGNPISIRKAFGTEDIQIKLILKTDELGNTVISEKNFPLYKGLIYAIYEGRPVGLLTRRLNQSEREASIERLKEYAKVRGNKESINGLNSNAILNQITSTFFLGEREEQKQFNIFFIKGENNLVFGDNIISHEDLINGKYDVQLDQFLSDLNHHVSKSQLDKKEEYRDIFGNKWNSYKEYLISEREDAPLMSDLLPYSDDIREPQFVNTYLEFSDGKKKEKAKPSKKNFAANLPTTIIGEGIVNLREDKINPSANEIEPPKDYKAPSFESLFGKEEENTEDKILNSNGNKITASEAASIKSERPNIMDLLGEDILGDANRNIGSDSLFDLELNTSIINDNEYSPINLEKEEQWFKENISSTIPFSKVQELINNKAFGLFTRNGEVLISEAATVGTVYHEAFHVVSNLYLTQKEQESLYTEWRNINNKKEASNIEVEEKLAEEFREYMLTDESPYENWFSKIANFIKNLLGLNTSKKEQLFERIKQGKFKNAESYVRSNINLYSVAKVLGATAKKDIMGGLTTILFQNLYKTGFSITDINNYNKGVLGEEKSRQFANIYRDSYKLMLSDINLYAPDILSNNTSKKDFISMLSSDKMVKAIVQMHLDSLKEIGILFNIEDDTNLDTLPEDERGRDTLGIVDSIEFSTKNSMPDIIKILITSLPQIEKINNKLSVKRNDLGLTIPTDYRRNVAILHNELAGVRDFQEQLNIINNLSDRIPEMSLLYKKLNTGDNTNEEDLYLQSKFRQQFDKNRYTFYIQLYDENNNYIIDANSSRMIDLIKSKWQGSLRKSASTKIEGGQQVLNQSYFEKYNKASDNIREKVLSFYKDLGISFSFPEKVNVDELSDIMNVLMDYISEGNINSNIFEQEGIKGYINKVIEQEVKTSFDYSDNQHISPAGKTVYNISLNDYNSIIINDINKKGLPSHLQWNEETLTGNPLMRYSNWAEKLNKGKRLSTIILEGGRIEETGEQGKLISDMTRGEAASFQFTSIMNGKFPFLRAGDKSLEKGFSFEERITEYTIQEATDIMGKYLAGELLSAYMLNSEGIGSDIQYYKDYGKKLRIFEGILNSKDQKKADSLMNSNKSREQIVKEIDEFISKDSVILSLQNYLNAKVEDNIEELLDNKLIYKEKDNYVNLGLSSEILERYVGETNEISKGQMNNIISQFTYQSLISNIEQTKLFTGDIAFFKDFFKRTSGLVGTGKTAWTGAYIDKLLNSLFPRKDKASDSNINTWVFEDVEVESSVYEDYVKAYINSGYTEKEARKVLDVYLRNNEADAQGYITLEEYREFNIRMGDWNEYRNMVWEKAMAGEVLSKNDIQLLNPEKPQMYAPQQYNELYVPTFYKLSVMPLIPSVIKGRTLEKLNNRMLSNGIGISVFASGNKVGAKNIRNFYNEAGEFNTSNEEISHVVDYKYMKKQLDINPETKDKVIFGTQFRKLILSGLNNISLTIKGKKVEGNNIIQEFNELIDKQVEIETNNLIKRLGITKIDDNNYSISNTEELKSILREEAISRSAPDNLIESFDYIFRQGDVKYAELSVNRNKIEQLLMSLVNNNLIKQKVFGGSLVQASSTGFETKARKQSDISKETWSSNLETLKFYQPTEDGTIAMEVYLPYKFKEILSREDIGSIDKRLRELVAFRIPTQGLNSIEAVYVKGFLPKEAGDLIIVPTEGVTKSGWDFDVDKLNVFYPNYKFNTETKKPEYVEYDKNNPTKEGVQNRLIELSRQIVLAKENFIPLTTPNTTDTLLEMEKEITRLNPELGRNENQRSKFVDWSYNLGIRQTYLLGKSGVGQAALQNVNHVMAQIAKLQMSTETPIYLRHHQVDNGILDLSKDKDVDNSNITIQDIISQTLNGFVDIAKEPFLKTLNITPETSNLFFFLTRIGTPLKDTVLFLNQPIIRDYLKELENVNSLYSEEKTTKKELIQQVIDKWGGIEEFQDNRELISTESLSSNIKDGGKNKKVQIQLLNDYISYKVLADELADLIKAVNFDTTNSSSIEGARTKIEQYQELLNRNIFINLDKLVSQTFLGSFYKATQTSIDLYKDLFITESNIDARTQLDKIKADFKNVRTIDIEKIMNIAKNDLISFLMQNSKINNQSKLGNFINAIFIDKSSNIPTRISTLKENSKLANNYFIRELVPILSTRANTQAFDSRDINNLKMFTKRLVKEEQNLITDAWRELFEYEGDTAEETIAVQDLASDLMITAILQSGLNNSPLSFTQFIPNEYYITLASRLIDNVIDDNIDLSEFRDRFYKNNYKSNDIVPKARYFTTNNDGSIETKSGRPYLKVWNKGKKIFKLYQNTYDMNGEKYIFEEVNKLGDGFNFKEFSTNNSVLSSNNILEGIDWEVINKVYPKNTTSQNKLIADVNDSNLNDKTKEEYVKRIKTASNREQIGDILKDLCYK